MTALPTPAELPGGLPRETVDELARFTPEQQAKAWRRVRCVKLYRLRQQLEKRPRRAWLPELIAHLDVNMPELGGLSPTTLHRWHKLSDKRHPERSILALVDRRGGDQKSQGSPEAWGHFEGLYLDDRQPSIALCWRQTKAEARSRGWAWCSLTSCRRQVDKRISPERQVFHRKPALWREQYEPGIEQDVETFRAGETHVFDHAQLDLWCRLGGSVIRPFITAALDWRTRRIVAAILCPTPNGSTILQALRRDVLDPATKGGPDRVVFDGGRDYQAWFLSGQTRRQRRERVRVEVDESTFGGVLGLLGIELHTTLAYCPNGKARIERVFSTLHQTFDVTFSSYCGGKVADRPESLEALLKRPEKLPTFQQIDEALQAWVDAYNARADHQIDDLVDDAGRRLSPDEAMAAWCDRIRTPADPAALDLCLQHWDPPITVGRQGVTVNVFGQRLSYGAFDAELSPYRASRRRGAKKPRVLVSFDADDLSSVRVYDAESMRFICTARQNERGGGADRAKVQRLQRRKRQYRKALKVVASDAELNYLSAAQLMADDDAGRRERPESDKGGPALKLVRTLFDGAAKAVQRHDVRQFATPAQDGQDEPDLLDLWGQEAARGGASWLNAKN